MATQLIPREIKTFQIYKRYVFFFYQTKKWWMWALNITREESWDPLTVGT
jgi:hypothetical protein